MVVGTAILLHMPWAVGDREVQVGDLEVQPEDQEVQVEGQGAQMEGQGAPAEDLEVRTNLEGVEFPVEVPAQIEPTVVELPVNQL